MSNLIALGDQVQETVMSSGQDVIAFLIVASDGTCEYRSPLTIEGLRKVLHKAVNEL
jgi:hypothetical protein